MKEDMEKAKQMPHICSEEELENIVGGGLPEGGGGLPGGGGGLPGAGSGLPGAGGCMDCVGKERTTVTGYNMGSVTETKYKNKHTGGLVGYAAKGSSNE